VVAVLERLGKLWLAGSLHSTVLCVCMCVCVEVVGNKMCLVVAKADVLFRLGIGRGVGSCEAQLHLAVNTLLMGS